MKPFRHVGQVRQAAASLSPLDYAATVAILAVYVVGTSLDEGPETSMDFYRAAATVIPTLLVAVAIQGRVLQLSTGDLCAAVSNGDARGGGLRRRDRHANDPCPRRSGTICQAG
jgi:hypothetical protein